MAYNKSGEVVKQISDIVNLQSIELPSAIVINPSIQPTLSTNPFLADVTRYVSQATTGTVSLQIPLLGTKYFYLCGIEYSLVKDVACDVATGNLYFNIYTVELQAVPIAHIPVITATAQALTNTINFPYPIKLGRGASAFTLNIAGTFTAGTMTRSLTAWGFYL